MITRETIVALGAKEKTGGDVFSLSNKPQHLLVIFEFVIEHA